MRDKVGTSRCEVTARKAGGISAGSTSADGAARHPYPFKTAAPISDPAGPSVFGPAGEAVKAESAFIGRRPV